MLAAQAKRVDLYADLEQQEDHTHVCQDLQLPAVGDITRSEWRHDQSNRQVAQDRGQADSPGKPAGADGEQENHPDLEHCGRGFERG